MNRQISAAEAIQLELMEARDQLIGLAAQDAERKFQFSRLRREVHQLNIDLKKQTDLLRENMTRAFNAENALLELQKRNAELIQQHQVELAAIYQSRSWKIGRILTKPVRFLRRASN